ncbi:MAG: DUF4331 domain-containing protein [Pseudomonadota bacterium]
MSFKRTLLALAAASLATTALASSHREAPFITNTPKVDGTDFYMFRSYEAGRAGFVTLIANYLPLQDSYGGPNYFTLDPDALYEIHIDNNGDAVEDLTFQFRFNTTIKGATVDVVNDSDGSIVKTPVPLANVGNYTAAAARNVDETYTLKVVRGDRRTGTVIDVIDATTSSKTFTKPGDNIGNKSFPNGYANYANGFIRPIAIPIPGCTAQGQVFVGQRKEGFVVNLGQVFDLVNLNPLGARNGGSAANNTANNIIGDKNVTSLALEVPVSCLTAGDEPVIGGWTTASTRQSRVGNAVPKGAVANKSVNKGPQVAGGPWTQVSRLGSPLVNEVVIGLPDKDAFNASLPKNDVGSFGQYVLFPSLPALIELLFPTVPAPATPRIADLLPVFVTGIQAMVNNRNVLGPTASGAIIPVDFTHPKNVALASPFTGSGEMLRLNTAFPTAVTAVAPAPGAAGVSDLGFLDCDLNGFPNGRRVIDDVVDIALTVAEGALTGTNGLQTCDLTVSPPQVVRAGAIVNDGAQGVVADYLPTFPYLNTPIPGATAAGPAGASTTATAARAARSAR